MPASISAIGNAVSDPPPLLGRELCRAFKQARMQIEDIAGIGLAAGRLARQKGQFAMRGGMLGQVVEHDQRMAATVAYMLGDGHAGERRQPAQPRLRGRGRNDENAALRRAFLADRIDRAAHGRGTLPD